VHDEVARAVVAPPFQVSVAVEIDRVERVRVEQFVEDRFSERGGLLIARVGGGCLEKR